MSEYQDLDRVIRQTEEAIAAIKVAIAQHNSIPYQKAQLDYIAATQEARKWRQLFEQAQKNGDINQSHYARERLWIHEDNAEKARQRMNSNMSYQGEINTLKQTLVDLEKKLEMARSKRSSMFLIEKLECLEEKVLKQEWNFQDNLSIAGYEIDITDRDDDLEQILDSIDSGHYDIMIDPIPIDYEENWGNNHESNDNNDEQRKKQVFTKFSNSQHISILDQAIEETRQTIAKVKQDYQNTVNSLEKNLKALEKAKQSLSENIEPPSIRTGDQEIDRELEELRKQLDNL